MHHKHYNIYTDLTFPSTPAIIVINCNTFGFRGHILNVALTKNAMRGWIFAIFNVRKNCHRSICRSNVCDSEATAIVKGKSTTPLFHSQQAYIMLPRTWLGRGVVRPPSQHGPPYGYERNMGGTFRIPKQDESTMKFILCAYSFTINSLLLVSFIYLFFVKKSFEHF